MTRRTPLATAAALAAVSATLAAGCGGRGPFGAEEVTGTRYVLTSIAGRALPAPYAQNLALDDRVQAGTLTLGADGRGEWTLRIAEAATGRVRDSREPFDYAWQGGGGRFAASFRCPDTASCIAPPHLFGRVAEGGGLVIDSSRVTRAPMLYVRADH